MSPRNAGCRYGFATAMNDQFMTRRDARIDVNQPEIVEAARKVGAFVMHTFRLGAGCPDLMVYFKGVWYPIEIKYGKGKLTLDEEKFHAACPAPIYIVRCVEDLYSLLGLN